MKLLSKLFLLTVFLMLTYSVTAQKWNKVYADTNAFAIRKATVAGKKYICFVSDTTFFLLNANGHILVKKSDFYSDVEFKDFNKDGYQDIILYYASNIPAMWDLLLFIPATGKFKQVKDFRDFPAPEPIKGTKYYYSYHKSGCADMNWDSDLFYIEDFKAIRIGNISGRQCKEKGEKDAVYIHRVHKDKKKLFKTLPVESISKYKDFKWGFIQEYWTENYRQFL